MSSATSSWIRVSEAFKSPVGTALTIKGWVRTVRDSKADGGLCFVAVSDGTCFDPIQVVCKASGGEAIANFEAVTKLTTGCSVEIEGVLVASQGKGQSVEVFVDASKGGAVRIVGLVENPDTYPISNKRHTFEYLREQAHLRVRTNTFGAIARVRHCLSMAVHRFFHDRGFYYVHTPIITASDCEGAGQMFRVSTLDMVNRPLTADGKHCDHTEDFFGKEAHLTVSGQLNVETYCCALSNVYTFGPTFRAENSNTARHLAEFWMIEPEMAFCDLMRDSQIAEDFIKYLVNAVLTERPDDMKFFDERIENGIVARLKHVLETPFRRLPYTEAIVILKKAIADGKKFDYPVKWGIDLQSEHERFLTEEHFRQPVILMNYPKGIKAFYMREDEVDPATILVGGAPVPASIFEGVPAEQRKTVAAMDVLVPKIGEIIGGSQREERLDVLDRRIEEMKLPAKEYWWYRDLRRYGTVPHAGFGLGFERLILFVTGMQNIRDVIPFPRAPKQAEF
jgi:asparaginyl-tRNA synthetase